MAFSYRARRRATVALIIIVVMGLIATSIGQVPNRVPPQTVSVGVVETI